MEKILSITKDISSLSDSDLKNKVSEYEHQIDQMVYKLYGLTQEEIEIIENFSKE